MTQLSRHVFHFDREQHDFVCMLGQIDNRKIDREILELKGVIHRFRTQRNAMMIRCCEDVVAASSEVKRGMKNRIQRELLMLKS